MKRVKLLSLIVLTCMLGLFQIAPAEAADSGQAESLKTKTPIKHLVFVMQENHTFDNYFGTYPGADGIPEGTKMPVDPTNPQAGYVEPWHIGTSTITDLSYNGNTFKEQFNNGQMNGFVSALNQRRENGKFAMGYYDERDIPYYWNLADHYVLFDRFFSSSPTGSFVNHMYSVAAVPPGSTKQ
jgi:phospholipase C